MSGVVVTGSTTPLGRACVRALLADQRHQSVLALGIEDPREAFGDLEPARLVYRRVDLTRPRGAHDVLFEDARRLGCDVLLHLALHRSARDVGPSAHQLNVETTRELLALAERHPTIRRFVLSSSSAVYRIDPMRATLLTEEDPLELSPAAPQSVRDRVEADLTVCTRMGLAELEVAVLRLAEVLAADSGSQLWDYLSSRVCLRPLGFDPMLNLLSLEDAAHALLAACNSAKSGVFNVPGADTLPLSLAIELFGRRAISLPGPLLAPLYRVRASAFGMEFSYDANYRRFHFSAVLDGSRARDVLGYEPRAPIAWPAHQHSSGKY